MPTTTNLYVDMQRAAERCKESGIDADALHTALTVVARRALQCMTPGDYTAEGIAAMNMNVVLDAVLASRVGTITIDGLVSRLSSTKKIEAIKAVRESFHMGLKEAKDLLEEAERQPVICDRSLTIPGTDLGLLTARLRTYNYNATHNA